MLNLDEDLARTAERELKEDARMCLWLKSNLPFPLRLSLLGKHGFSCESEVK